MTQPSPDSGIDVISCPHCGSQNRVPAAATGVPHCGDCHRALPWITQATDDDFESIVEQSKLPTLVDLWAPWCGPCRVVAPGVEQAARAYAGIIKVVKINVDDAPRTASRYQAQSIPLVLLLDHGKVRARQVGAVPTEPLLRWVKKAMTLTPAD